MSPAGVGSLGNERTKELQFINWIEITETVYSSDCARAFCDRKVLQAENPREANMGDIDEFKSYCALANQLIDAMSKERIAECLHVMAVHLAEYQRRFGEIPRPDLLELAGATELNDDQARLVRDGMELLVGYLASVRDGLEDEDGPIH